MVRYSKNHVTQKKTDYNLIRSEFKFRIFNYYKLAFEKTIFDFLIDDKSIFFKKNCLGFIKNFYTRNN